MPELTPQDVQEALIAWLKKHPESVSQSVNRFYERAESINKAYNTFVMLRKQGKDAEAEGVLTKYPQIVNHQVVDQYSDALRSIDREINEIAKSTIYSDAQKRQMIKEEEQFKMKLAQEAKKLLSNKKG